MKITFAQIGNYGIALKSLIEELGHQYIEPDRTNQETIEQGVKIAPETICLPCKVNLGNYLSAIKKGAEAVLMFNSQGQCRFRYYGLLQEKILKDYGHNVSFIIFSGKDIVRKLKSLGQVSLGELMRVLKITWQKIKLIDEMENLARFYRPREIKKGAADNLLKECLDDLKRTKRIESFKNHRETVRQKFNKIEIDSQRDVLKVGIIGEIFTVIDGFVNQNIEANLGELGVEARRDLNLTAFVRHNLWPFSKRKIKKQAKDYLTFSVGGHGLESVAEMLNYAKNDFDGVIHLFPFSCMPEVTVRPILEKIRQDKNIPLLSLSLDEQSGQAGIRTRLEAFVDLIRAKKSKKS
ncbi:MAG: hypothetical protein A3A94_00215 [Candidatus Portnoybacteria bacterium RIFCSPLOWO2_01_FULL_43_11]|uniref:DUF2229 domain-containing protein n=3 Tax=Candidatus Portnoyibacteriota TaxID=1817913 RepID=A0A1G2FBQ1_9BACT|nr:MAG: hypothetical protein A2815_02285 [Candidatus Portnoybacteria bacterium RIFCSPHIGHO2_01_FULL_40_12b]OGZ38973.1 MAG: hypothetical protein A3A94_00215 [Candidatus Portnoybacteria bacterium RIFCSPLOWO2_01_FULL_43_11]OGZ40496.1 MAG: hypothetical protein A3I20_00400 [Candidatus Portnoybacteria bacterium RIFCSPLOWO2_02_FULL_40_15]